MGAQLVEEKARRRGRPRSGTAGKRVNLTSQMSVDRDHHRAFLRALARIPSGNRAAWLRDTLFLGMNVRRQAGALKDGIELIPLGDTGDVFPYDVVFAAGVADNPPTWAKLLDMDDGDEPAPAGDPPRAPAVVPPAPARPVAAPPAVHPAPVPQPPATQPVPVPAPASTPAPSTPAPAAKPPLRQIAGVEPPRPVDARTPATNLRGLFGEDDD